MADKVISAKDLASYAHGDDGDWEIGSDSLPQPGVPDGTRVTGRLPESTIYPGNSHDYWIHIPAGYDPAAPAPLMVVLDGDTADERFHVTRIVDNLSSRGELPAIVSVFVSPGPLGPGAPFYGGEGNRSVEYDSVGDTFARFLLEEVLPEVSRRVHISSDPDRRAIFGISSGGAAAFTAVWERPDQFRKVLSAVGSFADIRGADIYPKAIRRTEPKPLRVFLQAGTNDLDTFFGSWYIANQDMAAALEYAEYDYRYVAGVSGHGHKHMAAILPDALRWLWRD